MRIGKTMGSMSDAARSIFSATIAAAIVLLAARADAAMVSGVYTNSSGNPLTDHQLHFENRISGDMFLVRSAGDGSFSSDLPPGTYDLRGERGMVLSKEIRVTGAPLNLGRVSEKAALDLRRPLEREGIGPSLIDTSAPATAHLTPPAPEAQPAPVRSTASFIAPTGQGPTVPTQ